MLCGGGSRCRTPQGPSRFLKKNANVHQLFGCHSGTLPGMALYFLASHVKDGVVKERHRNGPGDLRSPHPVRSAKWESNM